MSTAVDDAARRLETARADRVACAPVRELIGAEDVEAAYAVAQQTSRTRQADGARVVGRKIGLTSAAVQQQLGVHRPDFGTLFADMGYATGEPIGLAALVAPRVEAEVAYVLDRDLDDPDASVADVIRATDFVLAAIEVVDSRVRDWDIGITDTIADNASAGVYVLGTVPHSLRGLDLAACGMVLEHQGAPVSTGAGSACLGSPTVAVAWLARELARRGEPLLAGQVILSGALGPVVGVSAPGVYRARIDGLGSVEAVFA